ncbi:MAG: RICIN domain-containing protein, partial [Umezawaea sp.]
MRERCAVRKSAATRWRLRAACTAVLAVLGVVLPLPAASAATVDTGASYVLVNRNSGKALDVYGRSTADGARISQYTRNDGAWQQWRFVDSGDGYYRVRSVHSNKVLGFSSTADRAGLTQGTDADRPGQQFRLADSTGGYVRLLNRASGKAVDVSGSSTADGALVVQSADAGGANQQWRLIRLGADTTPPSTPGSPRA